MILAGGRKDVESFNPNTEVESGFGLLQQLPGL
jgi:hypothetical protein